MSGSDTTTTADLVARAQSGDQRAFAALVEGCYPQLWAVCLRITGHHHDAEDALQNALTAAWQNIDRFDQRAQFSTWAHRIATNAALALLRKRRDVPQDDLGADLVAQEKPLDAAIVDRSVVGQALAQLQPDFRQAIILREYGQLSYDAIATIQHVPIQTVKSRISRARGKLRAELAGHLS